MHYNVIYGIIFYPRGHALKKITIRGVGDKLHNSKKTDADRRGMSTLRIFISGHDT
jgi:hypothetical protein